ncbi:Insecticial toxin [Burkholderia sp. MSMB1589WGS]|uniref:Insecticial toxin n=1 Tax=Burkholderia sp. MSMB1589WGS TaxID=1636425 RepID=UPI000AB94013|nr:Insecticial toxin [Burkholderia sp. MSMB1589WGS]
MPAAVNMIADRQSLFARRGKKLADLSDVSDEEETQRKAKRRPSTIAIRGNSVNPRSPRSPGGPMSSDVLKRIAREFVVPSHMNAIGEASRKGNFAVSFRAAGEATVARLIQGAAAKGHDILEKTIKKSSLEKAYGTAGHEMLQRAREAGIEGYVGRWEGNALTGLYMSSDSPVGDLVGDESGHVHRILPIDMADLEGSLRPLKQQTAWEALPFTGDYDTHDMIQFGGSGPAHTVASNSAEENRIINLLNKAVAQADPLRKGKPVEFNVVRHGPQVNYPAFRMAEEHSSRLVGAVARAGEFPLAIVSRGEWSIAENIEQLQAFYQNSGVRMKESWRPGGRRSFDEVGGPGSAARLARRPSEKSLPFGLERLTGSAFWK